MVSPTSEVFHDAINGKAQRTLKTGKNPEKKIKAKRRSSIHCQQRKTKHDRILSMLRTRGGATIVAIARVTAVAFLCVISGLLGRPSAGPA